MSLSTQLDLNILYKMDAELSLEDFYTGFLSNFLSKGLKTNQLEVNTDEKTLKPIARLKEPRDLFALPKDKDNDCSQQAARWPTECQVLDERVLLQTDVPGIPEPYNQPTGNELKPRPVGEENGVVVYNYNPVSAVNYDKKKTKCDDSDGTDSDISSSESRGSSAERRLKNKLKPRFSEVFHSCRSSSHSNDDEDDDEDDEEIIKITNLADNLISKKNGQIDNKQTESELQEKDDEEITKIINSADNLISKKNGHSDSKQTESELKEKETEENENSYGEVIDDIWGNPSPYYCASPTKCFIQRIEARPVPPETLLPSPQTAHLAVQCDSSCSFTSPVVVVQHHHQNLHNQLNVLPNSLPLPVTHLGASSLNSYDLLANIKFINILSDCSSDNKNDCCRPLTQFSRSSVGGSKFLTQVHPFNKNEYSGLWFESRFESGNLAKAVKITDTYYELYLRPDLYTSRSKQWFYFRVERTKRNVTYRFSIVNLVKSDSLYNEGMRPLMYSTINSRSIGEGWRRCGSNIAYYRNDDDTSNEEDEENWSYTLTFNIEFSHDDDTVYFAHSYPYTYTDLQDYLMAIQKHPVKSKFCKLRLLCRSLAGNNVYYLTVTAPTRDEELMKKKKAIVVSARVHPSETPSSWMMKGLMDFITGESVVAKRLRHKFIFKLIPMLNPDGVIVGNTRNSLTGKDLNRQYRTVIRETYPSIWYTKAMIKRLIDECGVAMYCDMHAHSRRQNIFVYGCENRRNQEKKLTEQVFPLMMHKNVADKFSFENCKFKIQRSKEGTGRIVVWMLGVTNSYTIEASFGGSSLGSRKGTHFNTGDYEHMGRGFCETLLDYCDENPQKERLRLKIIERLLKEGSSAEEPLNIPLSDYSSDEGDTSSSSDNEGKADRFSDLEGPCCQPLRAPPCSPEASFVQRRMHRKKKQRSKSWNMVHRKRSQRTLLDMPTTDPGNDLFFSTDDENCTDNESSGIVPRSRRYLLQSDLQRRYIDATCGCAPTTTTGTQRMPPELIVTPANQASSTKNTHKIPRTPEAPKTNNNLLSTDLIAIPRRNSMHNIHSSGSCILKLSIQNLGQSPQQSPSNEIFSPKSKIWMGYAAEVLGCFETSPRPISRAKALPAPPIKQTKQKTRDELADMLTECSKKLSAWQLEALELSNRNKLNLRVSMSGTDKDTSKKENNNKLQMDLTGRKKKRNLLRITQTTKIINCFNKHGSQSAINITQSPRPFTPNTSLTLPPLKKSSKTNIPKKFKPVGLVATAMQTGRKPKRQRSTLININNKQIEIPLVETATTSGQLENEKSIARKVRTKLKKKKSVTQLKGSKS